MNRLPLSVRDPVRFEMETVHNFACKQVVRIAQLGAMGKISKDDAPGYAVGLKALTAILDRTAPVPRTNDGEQRPVAINVAIVSTHAAGHAVEGNGVAVRFSGGHGAGA